MDVCVISGEEVCYDLHVKYPSQRLSIQLRAAARGDWIMRTVTLPTDLSFDEFIDGLLRSGAQLEEIGHWGINPLMI